VLCCMCIISTIQILHPYVKNQIEMDVDIMRAAAAVIELLPRMCKLPIQIYIMLVCEFRMSYIQCSRTLNHQAQDYAVI
jgi:hypothetical protein